MGLPLIILFSASYGLDLKVKGVWIAFGATNGLLVFLFLVVMFKTNWHK